jgi:hypothetical protein
MATCKIGSKIYSFGGFNTDEAWTDDMFTFDLNTHTWEKLNCSGKVPAPRDKSQMLMLDEQHLMLFGGFGPQVENQPMEQEQLSSTTPTNPKEQEEEDEEGAEEDEDEEGEEEDGDFHTASFGWFSDLNVFNIQTNQWASAHLNGTAPSQRAAFGMAAASVRHEDKTQNGFVIFGGRDNKQRVNDTFFFSITTENSTYTANFATPAIKGTLPAPRSFHSMTPVTNVRSLVFGGMGRMSDHLKDFSVFDFGNQQQIMNFFRRRSLCSSSS